MPTAIRSPTLSVAGTRAKTPIQSTAPDGAGARGLVHGLSLLEGLKKTACVALAALMLASPIAHSFEGALPLVSPVVATASTSVDGFSRDDRPARTAKLFGGERRSDVERVVARRGAVGGVLSPATVRAPAHASKLFGKVVLAATRASTANTVPAALTVTSSNRASPTVLVDPPQVFARFAELIEGAEHDVALKTFAWDASSDPAKEVFASLARLQAKRIASGATAPVKVRMLIDTMRSGLTGNTPTAEMHLEQLRLVKEHGLDPRYVDVQLIPFEHDWLGSMHGKTLVVDGARAIVTGANMNKNDDYATGEHDAGFELEGEVARALLADFDHCVVTGGKRWTTGLWGYNYAPIPLSRGVPADDSLKPIDLVAHRVRAPTLVHDGVPMMVVGKLAHDAVTPEDSPDHPLTRATLALLEGAEREIKLQTPNLNETLVKNAIVDAVLRGVTVKIVLAKGYEDATERLPLQGGTNVENVAALAQRLARAGISDVESRLQVRWYARPDASAPVQGHEARASHVKMVSVDGQVTLVTSLNMDTQSWRGSNEVGVFVDDAATAQAWAQQLFDADHGRGAPAIDE